MRLIVAAAFLMCLMACGGGSTAQDTSEAGPSDAAAIVAQPAATAAELADIGGQCGADVPCVGRLVCTTYYGTLGFSFPLHDCRFPCSAGCPQGMVCRRFVPDGPSGVCW